MPPAEWGASNVLATYITSYVLVSLLLLQSLILQLTSFTFYCTIGPHLSALRPET